MSFGNIFLDAGIMVLLLVLSAVFSGSETAFFSLNSLEKEALRRRNRDGSNRIIQMLFTDPDQVLVTILTGNMFVNIFASSVSEAIGSRIFTRSSELYSIISMTVILLVFGEMTPKTIAVRHSQRFAHLSAGVLRHVHTLLRPVTRPLGYLRHAVISAYPGQTDRAENSDEAILSAIRMGYRSNTIHESELSLLERFFRFRKKSAVDVMIPRVDCRPVNASLTIGGYLAIVTGTAITDHLIPLFRDDVDHITGYIRRSSLLRYRMSGELDTELARVRHAVHAVPRGKDVRELLEEMTAMKTEMAVVVDEYGGTEGIVTTEAVIRYLFSDFAAPSDQSIKSVDDDVYRIAGRTNVRDVEAVLHVELPRESRTIGGMVTDALGDLPREGSSVEVKGYRFTVERVAGHRVAWLRVQAVHQ